MGTNDREENKANRRTSRSYEDTRLSHIAREVLQEAPSVLRTRNHVHCLADYAVSPTCARHDLHHSNGIKATSLKGYGLDEISRIRTMKVQDELYDVSGILVSETRAPHEDNRQNQLRNRRNRDHASTRDESLSKTRVTEENVRILRPRSLGVA